MMASYMMRRSNAATEDRRGTGPAPRSIIEWERDKETESIASVHRSLPFPTDDELRWLLSQGVEEAAMSHPWIIRGGMVQFDDDTFEFVSTGVQAIIFRTEDCGETIDLVAWHSRTGRLASWRGVTFCLGDLEQLFNPATWFMGDALRLHQSPLDWLRSGRDGIVILRPGMAHAYLAQCPRLVCADAAYARRVERWLERPKLSTEILVEVSVERAAI
jgi:hypothetical protein